MWRRNGLSIVLFVLMAVFLVAQALTGWQVHNEELAQYGLPSLPFWSYLTTGHFSSATFENWESEFLQPILHAVREYQSLGVVVIAGCTINTEPGLQ